MQNYETLGEVLKRARLDKGLTQLQVCDGIDMGGGKKMAKQYLSDLELGFKKYPSPEVVEQLCSILDIDSEWVYYMSGRFPPYMVKMNMRPMDFARCMRGFKKEMEHIKRFSRYR